MFSVTSRQLMCLLEVRVKTSFEFAARQLSASGSYIIGSKNVLSED